MKSHPLPVNEASLSEAELSWHLMARKFHDDLHARSTLTEKPASALLSRSRREEHAAARGFNIRQGDFSISALLEFLKPGHLSLLTPTATLSMPSISILYPPSDG